MENQTQQAGLNLSEENVFGKIGKLVMINEQLSQNLQTLINENERLKKEIELFKAGEDNKKPKIVSKN